MDDENNWTAMLNFIMPLGVRRSIAASSTRQYNGKIANTLQAINAPPPGPGWGWRVSASDTPEPATAGGCGFEPQRRRSSPWKPAWVAALMPCAWV